MFQSFTGNTRRPRQVNLSGKSSNPFAASSSGSPQTAVDIAREDRAKRQQERQRLQATSRIQRTWRGHMERRKSFALWRSIWDDKEETATRDDSYPSADESLAQFSRLMLFFSPRRDHIDIRRLNHYGRRQVVTASSMRCDGDRWESAYTKLLNACLQALRVEHSSALGAAESETLEVLIFAVSRAGNFTAHQASEYYEILADLADSPHKSLEYAILAPLHHHQAYAGLVRLLARPLDSQLLSQLKADIHSETLSAALSKEDITGDNDVRQRLWLLGNIIFLCGVASSSAMDNTARLLGSLAGEVDFDGSAVRDDNLYFDREILAQTFSPLPLNTFLAGQLAVLTSRDTIKTLLQQDAKADARISANMALTLMRCFPRKADDIRLWLYAGPTHPTLFFWQAMERSEVFKHVSRDSRAVVKILSPHNTVQHKDDWTVIMMFLELYTFLIKIVDDEEFLGRSRTKQGTITTQQVGELVTFLKNLGFTLCFNQSDLNELILSPSSAPRSPSEKITTPYSIAGIPGLDLDYLKGVVTGLLRAIYERDSRRHFLSADHWLMTSRFDMTAFIPAVVQEEVNRRFIAEQDEEDEHDESELPIDGLGTSQHTRTGSHAAIEARLRAQKKASRQRYLEAVTPRLEILQNMPFFIPFDTRVEIFRQFVLLDQRERRDGHVDQESWRTNMMFNPNDPERRALASRHASVRRGSEFHDAYEQFYNIGDNIKEPIQITFFDEHGLQEAGIDGGGVTKEFLTSVMEQAFDGWEKNQVPRFFKENDAHLLYPNPTLMEDLKVIAKANNSSISDAALREQHLDVRRQFEFLGRVIGKCLYEGILIDVAFAGFFLKKWALYDRDGGNGYRAGINDLRDLDESLYKGLLDVKNAPDAAVFDLNFTVDDVVGDEEHHVVVEHPLMPNGAQTAVTNENKLLYVNRMSWWRLQGQSAEQTKAFLEGLSSIISPTWLSMFNQSELQTLIGGAATGIDVQDLRRNTQYGGTYVIGDDGQEHPSVKLFWDVMQTLPDEDRQKVLKFVTSTPRGPLLGFAHLNPKFSIRDSGSDENRFPTTSTCVNLLKLPMYKSEAVMRKKLLYAVNSGAGFDLS